MFVSKNSFQNSLEFQMCLNLDILVNYSLYVKMFITTIFLSFLGIYSPTIQKIMVYQEPRVQNPEDFQSHRCLNFQISFKSIIASMTKMLMIN